MNKIFILLSQALYIFVASQLEDIRLQKPHKIMIKLIFFVFKPLPNH